MYLTVVASSNRAGNHVRCYMGVAYNPIGALLNQVDSIIKSDGCETGQSLSTSTSPSTNVFGFSGIMHVTVNGQPTQVITFSGMNSK